MKLKFTLVIATLLLCFNTTAQTKLGTVNSAYIIGKMPQMKQVLERTKAYGITLDSIYKIKADAYTVKAEAYKKDEKTITSIEKEMQLKVLYGLEQELGQFKRNGTQLMQLRRDEYMRPLYKKLNDMISQIAKEKGYSQILTTTGNQFAYLDEKHDITQFILDKLGIKEGK